MPLKKKISLRLSSSKENSHFFIVFAQKMLDIQTKHFYICRNENQGLLGMDELLKILKALSDKNRLRIVKMLQQKNLCVCEMTDILGLATSTVSNHLSILKDADIISDLKDGKWIDYYLNTRTKNIFLNGLLPLLTFWLNNDAQVQADLQKLKTTNRLNLCKV